MDKSELKKLEDLYLKAKETYYLGNPIMTDSEFDQLEAELKQLGSKVVSIVGLVIDRNAKYPHKTPMLSLAKYQTNKTTGKPPTEQATDWMKSKVVGKQEHFSFGCKYDGNAANAIYKSGHLVNILSRGNGTLGRDITSKLINQVPKTIPITDGTVEVRAEVVIPKDIFAKKYSEFKNERNFVAGVLNKDSNDPAVLNDIVFMAHEIKHTEGNTSEYISVDELSKWGFNKKYPLVHFYYHYTEFEKAFFKMKDYREKESPFLLDGIVIKVAEKYRNNFGENGHDPNWAIAIKFAPKDVKTTVKDIKWNFGKTGTLTPVAILEPVDLDGSIVGKASIYNYGYLVKNQVYPGSIVTLVKSGDIIPQIIEVNAPGDVKGFNPPTHCKYCGSKLEVVNDIHLSCVNDDCEGVKGYLFSQGVNCLELFGVGGATIDEIWYAGFHKATDLLNPDKFNKQLLINSGRFTDGRSLEKLFEEIEKVNELTLRQVIMMLGFKGMGWTTATQIANKIAGIDYSFDSMTKVVVNGFDDGEPKRVLVEETVKELSKFITIVYPTSRKNLTFVELTGSPKDSVCKSKDDFLDLIKPLGYEHGKISEATYLVTDDLASKTSKMTAATKKGIEIYTYGQFIAKFCPTVVIPISAATKSINDKFNKAVESAEQSVKTSIKPKAKGLF
jgi:DNA ligase (NAD+)